MIIGSAKAIVFFDTSVDDVSSLLVPSPIPGDIVHDQLDIALNTSMLPRNSILVFGRGFPLRLSEMFACMSYFSF